MHVERSDVFRNDVDEWEDYFWIDVEITREDHEQIRATKANTVEQLLSLFSTWRGRSSIFADDLEGEFTAAGNNYIKFYAEFLARIEIGDASAIYDFHVDSMVVEAMIRKTHTTTEPPERIVKAAAFFASDYFRNVP